MIGDVASERPHPGASPTRCRTLATFARTPPLSDGFRGLGWRLHGPGLEGDGVPGKDKVARTADGSGVDLKIRGAPTEDAREPWRLA